VIIDSTRENNEETGLISIWGLFIPTIKNLNSRHQIRNMVDISPSVTLPLSLSLSLFFFFKVEWRAGD
jgi:hypothetical protein